MRAWDKRSKPLLHLRLAEPLRADYKTEGTPPTAVKVEIHEIAPVFVSEPYAVYPMPSGDYQVHVHGAADAKPFRTSDLKLAVRVCNAWAALSQEGGER